MEQFKTSSSISSSDSLAWKRFFRQTLLWTVGAGVLLYAWIVVVDPYDTLHVSPDLDRAPLAMDARPWFHALARDPAFDSAVIGTSTSRLLKPDELNQVFDARFANLSMNEATEHEQSRVFDVFVRHHDQIKVVIIGVGRYWCTEGDAPPKYAHYVFPEHMYDDDPWNDYAPMLSFKALRASLKQFATIALGRRRRWGPDGYQRFVPDGTAYDLDKARAYIYGDSEFDPSPVADPVVLDDAERETLTFPSHPLLARMLASLPEATLKIVYFVPFHVAEQPRPGSRAAAVLDVAKQRIADIARETPNAHCVDFLIPSVITKTDTNYWDPVHYTVEIASALATMLGDATRGVENDDAYRILR